MQQPWHSIVARGDTALVLVRHGRTAYNHEQRFLGRTDIPLDDEGRRQVRALAPWRGAFERVVSSPLARARMTAEVLSDDLVFDEALAELDQGYLEGRKVADAVPDHPDFFAAWADDPGSVRVPGGGRLDELRDGAMAALSAWARRHPGCPVAVVSHQLVLSSVLATLDGAPLAQWRRYALPNAGVAMLSFDGSALRVEARSVPAPPG
jgi:probable phosphoglycerate mutase